jgi:hypothetical protein
MAPRRNTGVVIHLTPAERSVLTGGQRSTTIRAGLANAADSFSCWPMVPRFRVCSIYPSSTTVAFILDRWYHDVTCVDAS